jgi:glycogen debranching enzyme
MRCRDSFNRRFWNLDGRCCFDVLTDGIGDVSIRPNQLLAISLPHAVLANDRQATVLEKVRTQLLTPLGVRTLSPDDPAYRGRYGGDVVARDRAYHQGSAYPWLLGPYVSAMVRIYGRTPAVRTRARQILAACLNYLHTDGLGQLPELFDGDMPQRPGGAVASARSVAEILRCYAEDLLEPIPSPLPSTSDAAQFSK